MYVYQIIGWGGAFFFIAAYFLLSIRKLKADNISYQAMNVAGAVCLIIHSIKLNDPPNLIINLVWMGIGLFSIAAIVLTRKRA